MPCAYFNYCNMINSSKDKPPLHRNLLSQQETLSPMKDEVDLWHILIHRDGETLSTLTRGGHTTLADQKGGKNMANVDTQFQVLLNEELMDVNGGIVFATIVVAGVTVKVTGTVAGVYGTGYAIGRGLGYF